MTYIDIKISKRILEQKFGSWLRSRTGHYITLCFKSQEKFFRQNAQKSRGHIDPYRAITYSLRIVMETWVGFSAHTKRSFLTNSPIFCSAQAWRFLSSYRRLLYLDKGKYQSKANWLFGGNVCFLALR